MSLGPMHENLDLRMGPKKWNGTLFLPKDHSIARDKPNPEADAIWEEWELMRYGKCAVLEVEFSRA